MSPTSLTPYFRDAPTHLVEDWGPLDEATGPPMATAGFTLWEEGDQSVGIWVCGAGPSRWLLETHEFIYVVAGRMIVTRDGGEPVELATGDSAFFERGWAGTWEILEELRKLYVIFS